MTFRHKKRFIISSSFHFGNPKIDGAAHNLFGGSNPSSSGNETTSQRSVGMQCLATNRAQQATPLTEARFMLASLVVGVGNAMGGVQGSLVTPKGYGTAQHNTARGTARHNTT